MPQPDNPKPLLPTQGITITPTESKPMPQTEKEVLAAEAKLLEQTDNGPKSDDGEQPETPEGDEA